MAGPGAAALRDRELWPWDKFRRALGQLPATSESGAVLVMTGSMNPAHRGHVEMLHSARERLRRAGYSILAGWVSPWDDAKTASKAKRTGGPHLSTAFRLRQAEYCTQDDEFVSVASWEASAVAGREPDYMDVVEALQQAMRKDCGAQIDGRSVSVFLVCGSDESKCYRRLQPAIHQGLVLVPRHGNDCFLEKPLHLVYLAEPTPGRTTDLSSSKLLVAIKDGDTAYVERAVPPPACKFILDPSEDESRELAADFGQLSVSSADAGPWPGGKLVHEIPRVPEGKIVALLVASGSMSPAHRGHVAMLHQAKARLEEVGYAVIGAWLSPTSTARAAREAKQRGSPELRLSFRMEMARLSVCDDELVSVGSWEAGVEDHDPKPREIAGSLHFSTIKHFQESLEGVDVKTFYVCGSDCASNLGIWKGFTCEQNLGVVVVPRNDDGMFLEMPHSLVFRAEPVPGDGADLSSGQVRMALQSGDVAFASQALMPAAARFLLSPTPDEYSQHQRDFELLGIKPPAASSMLQVKGTLKATLKAWTGPGGVLAGADLVKVLKMLDPSWTEDEMDTLMFTAITSTDGTVQSDQFVDWIFESR
mmetsp:Transcript_59381/g.133815  ORF Transcript_59381/g.133815 Transcript_59381/m.133815 type:complete len:591 (-) Transcript_59381:143-1915(-)